MKETLNKFLTQPLVFVKQGFNKLFIAPFKYGRKNDYDASRYWEERFKEYGFSSLKSVGIEGMSHEENIKMYKEAGATVKEILFKYPNLQNLSVLEIGCGTGFYTGLLHELGVKNFTAIDITDTFFKDLQTKFPGYHFQKKDITTDQLENSYDLIIFIDVIEHIVTPEKLRQAMIHVRQALKKGGSLVIAPLMNTREKKLFHLHLWTLEDVTSHFQGLKVSEPIPFRYGSIVTIQS
jgi:2-polyprenyl-3-methyl-5-hydroxy-6-metoxy-1,4-benzoquinol methylase